MNIEIYGYCLPYTFFGEIGGLAGGFTLRYTPERSTDHPQMDRPQIGKISKALADETRLRIFEAISRSGQMNCGEIVSMRDVTPATVSHHLKVLSEAGLVVCRREGQFVYSEAVPETLREFTRALSKMALRKRARQR